MQSVLLIAHGPEASAHAETALRQLPVVAGRAQDADSAGILLEQAPFDAIICAIDEPNPMALDCVSLVRDASCLPGVIVTGPLAPEVSSLHVNTSVVCTTEGPAAVLETIRRQLRRVPKKPSRPRKILSGEFSFSFRADPARIGQARSVAAGFVQRTVEISAKELLQLELVIEEMLANAVYHGSLQISSLVRTADRTVFARTLHQRLTTPPWCTRQVRLHVAADGRDIRVTVADEGPGFDVLSTAAAPTENAIHLPSGRGLLLMRAFSDSVDFNDRGNAVTVTRSLRRSAQPAAAPPSSIQTQIAVTDACRVL